MQSDSREKVNILGSKSIGHCEKRSSYERMSTLDMQTWTGKYNEVGGIFEHLLRSVTNVSLKTLI